MSGFLAAWILVGSLTAAEPDVSRLPAPVGRSVGFTADIQPILEFSCLRCHGTERPKGRFSLATREAALKGGDNGMNIIVGDSSRSPLIHFVAGLVPDMEMPPSGKGDPLTAEQIAVLRAWIDQGVAWETNDLSQQYRPMFSVTPAIRYVTVRGSAEKFQVHQWVRRGFSEGVSDFRLAQKLTNGVSVSVEGHAMTDDYKITLDIRKSDVGFARGGFEQYRKYFDDHGPYYPFRARAFSTTTPGIFSLHQELHLDRGKAFVEFGLTRRDWPETVIGYEYLFRNGTESTEQWGPVTQGSSAGDVTRNIYPARKRVNEDVHVLRLDVSHEIAGVQVEDNLRAEFYDLKTWRVNAVDFPAGQAYPTALTVTRESHEQLLLANTLHGGKSIKDWLYVSAGYLFSRFEPDAALHQQTVDGSGRPAAGTAWTASHITLKEQAHVFNVNALAGSWEGLTTSLGVLNEWTETSGFGTPNYRENDPLDPTMGTDLPGLVDSDFERMTVEESLVTRYTGIPFTVLFAEAKLKQERDGRFEQGTGEHDFIRDTDATIDWQEYKAGFEVSPWRRTSLNASYKHRLRQSEYHDDVDQSPVGSPGIGYPAFIRSRKTESDMVETRLALRPVSWLKTTLSYQLALTDYRTRTDPWRTIGFNSAGGRVFAGEFDSSTYSANFTITPARRWYLMTTLAYQDSRTWTADNGSAAVVPYRGDTWSILTSATYSVSESTALSGSYSFSRARFAQRNALEGLPLGIEYDLHGVQVGVSHRWSALCSSGVQYGFYTYDEPTARGFNDYTAHLIFGTLTLQLP